MSAATSTSRARPGASTSPTNGATNVVCVNTVPGAANLEARCKGVIDGMTGAGQAAKQLPLPPTSFGNPTAIAEAIKAALLKDDTIDGVITISQADADSAANGIMQAGGAERVKLGGFDMNQTVLDRIASGAQLFAIDQQPYMQGYLAVSLLNGFVNFGAELPTAPILTGPAIVDASNVEQTMAGVKRAPAKASRPHHPARIPRGPDSTAARNVAAEPKGSRTTPHRKGSPMNTETARKPGGPTSAPPSDAGVAGPRFRRPAAPPRDGRVPRPGLRLRLLRHLRQHQLRRSPPAWRATSTSPPTSASSRCPSGS